MAGAPRSRTARSRPWHPFPLVELAVLLGLVLLVLGALRWDTDRGKLLLVFGMALGSLGGLDTALREHFAGYRSHTMLLACAPRRAGRRALLFARVPWTGGRDRRGGHVRRHVLAAAAGVHAPGVPSAPGARLG